MLCSVVGASPSPAGEGGFLVILCAFLLADGIFLSSPVLESHWVKITGE